ncbi:MAG: hypothetical protein UU73_C0001G0220 [Candidatus Daviesbacteria bacterium GW2011_GWA1_41_61]|uniref:Uncharacterized protein n=1 Tax=Candidatus Daviesbacteria bacterium GW2011_GWA2_40_9 TaxID=1618424 RepID=A0A0G0U0L1_9BACT|nr:MAG: hypothetical protein UU26_C0007G0002 [Candidatus Daviesbacteria bacterium GW2011_GWC1_40_9]KKR82588.1 MAG: hypothetical protein UU29_C0011G0035 [Candidatus Daviesbacteria bacterium GW2011_GWA2_40_9]KKR93039.1 MAG: hypothetical protein UU44_C0004G0221 [Candidatus Daviesbacteria bacterium GW2011_GWB1_41_15]KKS15583.1 MAG: hypothetical protein UU73_C0001G0220 [Candidatus Daviesbacteria bacterium GW2011_GWA1_41_61]
MDQINQTLPIKKFSLDNPNKLFLGILIASIILGGVAGFLLANSEKSSATSPATSGNDSPKTAQQDNRTFRDFAEGVIQKRSAPKDSEEYVEGTHILVRQVGSPVALTSSVIDLSQYEGKKVKVFGETQKAIKEGWLMDVGKVEVK